MDKKQAMSEHLRRASEMSIKHYDAVHGNNDSAVCIALAERTRILFAAIHKHTTVDAFETVRFVHEGFRRLEKKGVKCTINFPVYRPARDHMEPDSSKAHATDSARPLLFFDFKKAWQKWPFYNNGGPLSRKTSGASAGA